MTLFVNYFKIAKNEKKTEITVLHVLFGFLLVGFPNFYYRDILVRTGSVNTELVAYRNYSGTRALIGTTQQEACCLSKNTHEDGALLTSTRDVMSRLGEYLKTSSIPPTHFPLTKQILQTLRWTLLTLGLK